MILAPRPPFRASRRPPGRSVSKIPAGISHDDFQGSPAGSQGNSARGSGESNSSVPVSDVPARLGIPVRLFRASLRVGRQDSKPAPGPVSTAIGTKDKLRQYVAPLRLAPEGETTIIMVAVYWEDNPEDLLQRLEEIHRGDQPPRMGEIPGETPGDHINRKKRKRSGARVKALRTYRENEKPRIAAGIFLWDTLQLVLSSPKL